MQCGHLTVTIIEQVKNKCKIYRKEREKFYITKLNTLNNALWFNRVTGSEKGVAQLLAHKVFSSTTLGF